MACFTPQTRAGAFRTRLRVQVFRELFAHHHRIGLAIAPLEVGNDALEGMLAHERPSAFGEIRERYLVAAAAIQHDLLRPFGEPSERTLEIESEMLGKA